MASIAIVRVAIVSSCSTSSLSSSRSCLRAATISFSNFAARWAGLSPETVSMRATSSACPGQSEGSGSGSGSGLGLGLSSWLGLGSVRVKVRVRVRARVRVGARVRLRLGLGLGPGPGSG